MPHTDIQIPAWLAPFSAKIKAFAHLMRLDRPIGTWLLLLPGWWAIALAQSNMRWELFILFGIGAIVMRGAGCVINDLWDHKMDARVARTKGRPLPSGRVTRREAYAFLFFLLMTGFAILMSLPYTAIITGIVSTAFIIVYPLMKRITWWPQLFLGLTFNFGALLGTAAVKDYITVNAWWMYAAGIFWTLGYDTIYAHQDKEDDALVGIKSTARLFGAQSKHWVASFYLTMMALLIFAAPTAWMLIPAAHLGWQIYAWDMDDPASSLRFFKSNRDAGLLILLVLLIFS